VYQLLAHVVHHVFHSVVHMLMVLVVQYSDISCEHAGMLSLDCGWWYEGLNGFYNSTVGQ
jgi:hypothetical protein